MFTIVITEGEQELYRQSVKELDLLTIIHAVNAKEAASVPQRRKRRDAGKKRELEPVADSGDPFDV